MPINRDILLRFKKNHTCFVETGTYEGATTQLALDEKFSKVYTIELDEEKYCIAAARFENYPNVQVLKGNSPTILEMILRDINEPVFFWLDAHPDYGDTVLMEELAAIGSHHIRTHTILIDDMRNMGLSLFNVSQDRILKSLICINPIYNIIFVDDWCASGDIVAASI